jgi:hypothetical protein
MEQTAGFRLAMMCFPLHEWANWRWGREDRDQLFAFGPLRLGVSRITICR